ncbi:HD family phosphohydrolase [Magnetococcales bacterium HHB-1]
MLSELEKPAQRIRNRQQRGVGHWLKTSQFVDIALFIALVLFLTLLYSPETSKDIYLPAIGTIAAHDIKADRDIQIEDKETTHKRRQEAKARVLPVYDWDAGMVKTIQNNMHKALKELSESRRANPNELIEKLRETFGMQLEEQVPIKVFQQLLDLDPLQEKTAKTVQDVSSPEKAPEKKVLPPYQNLLDRVNALLKPFENMRIVGAYEVFKDLQAAAYIAHHIANRSEVKMGGVEGVMDLDSIREQIFQQGETEFKDYPPLLRVWLLSEISAQIRPNFIINLTEISARQNEAANAVESVYFTAKKGEMIVREGEIVTEAAFRKISALHKTNSISGILFRIVGLGGTLAIFFFLGWKFLYRTSRKFPRDKKTLYVLAAIILIVALVSRLFVEVGEALVLRFLWPTEMMVFLPPVALGAALASLMVGSRASLPGGALIVGAILSFLSSNMLEEGLPLFIYFFLGSLVGGFTLRTCRHRFSVLASGVWIALVQACTMPMISLLQGHTPDSSWLIGMGMAFSSGLLSGLLGLALIPLFEWSFNLMTDSRLLELASGDHPLLKKLSLRSPGTYHHSVMMGNLAEAAAEAIGANPLMARVMALYHDIGKMTKPNYFVENQSGANRHDQLSPSMSAKVIMSHIKDGVELAVQHKLGGPILDAITEHQGTGLLRYFYNKALRDSTKKGEMINEEDYRYPGPKPQSRESGILMVADSVEAASRLLKNPSPSQIQSLVRRIIDSKISDGQLDECNLTLRELAMIEEAFYRVLTLGFFHHRIEYPDQIRKRRV